MRILIPMAGEAKRFKEAGYTFPKPLIDVNGKPMIQLVIESLPQGDEYIFICQKEHVEKYELEIMLKSITKCKTHVIQIDHITEGAACTALLAKDLINDKKPLLIANSDQYVEYNSVNFDVLQKYTNATGIIFTHYACHPKWSFVQLDTQNQIKKVIEKVPISNVATNGIYWYEHGAHFVWAAELMISKNIRTNNEFYIAPVYNELIMTDYLVLPFFVDKMYGLGTPEDLETFIRR